MKLKRNITAALMLLVSYFTFGQYGSMYASFSDYQNDKPLPDYQIVPNTYSSVMGISMFKIKQNGGPPQPMKVSDFPAPFFTYKNVVVNSTYLIRIVKNKAYIVLSVGTLCYYASYTDQNEQFLSETISGEMEKFKAKPFEELLQQKGLFEQYKADKPHWESGDSQNDHFNKIIDWRIKYFDLLNGNKQ